MEIKSLSIISADKVVNELKGLLTKRTAVTLSLAYYTVMNGNAQVLADMDKDITSALDKTLRRLIAVKWDNDESKWKYSSDKSKKVINDINNHLKSAGVELQLEYNKSTKEDFVKAIDIYVNTELEEVPVDADVQRQKDDKSARRSVDKGIEKLVELGYSHSAIMALLQDAVNRTGIQRTKTAA